MKISLNRFIDVHHTRVVRPTFLLGIAKADSTTPILITEIFTKTPNKYSYPITHQREFQVEKDWVVLNNLLNKELILEADTVR